MPSLFYLLFYAYLLGSAKGRSRTQLEKQLDTSAETTKTFRIVPLHQLKETLEANGSRPDYH